MFDEMVLERNRLAARLEELYNLPHLTEDDSEEIHDTESAIEGIDDELRMYRRLQPAFEGDAI